MGEIMWLLGGRGCDCERISGMGWGDMGGFWFAREPESCAGCGQVPPPLIGAALLPSAGKVFGLGIMISIAMS